MKTPCKQAFATLITAVMLTGPVYLHAADQPPANGGNAGTPNGGNAGTPNGGNTGTPNGGTTGTPNGGTTGTGGTGGTGGTTAPKPCYVPVPNTTPPAGVEVCKDITIPTGGTGATDSSTFFKNVTPDQLGNFTSDQLKSFDPKSASGFSATQLGSLSPDALKGASSDLIKNLSPTAVTGLTGNQVTQLSPDAVKGLSTTQIQNLTPDAVKGLTPDQVKNLQPTQVAALTPTQFNSLDTKAVAGVTSDQFKTLSTSVISGLDSTKIAALDTSVIKTLDASSLAKLNSTEVKKLDSKDLSEVLLNLNKQTVAPADVKNLLPTGWTVDDKTGKVTAPAGSTLTLPTATTTTTTANVTLPPAADLTKGLALGGDSTSGSVIDGMKTALDKAGLTGYNLTQTNGVLNVQGTGSNSATKMSFLPDSSNIKQAGSGTTSGVSQSSDGKYVITTADGVQVPVIPALKSADAVTQASPGAKVEVDASGSTKITQSGKTPIVGIADPVVSTSAKTPGIYREGTGANEKVTVVYTDGTAQTMKPTIQDPTEFKTAAKAIPGVGDVTVNTDGTIKVTYNGQSLQLKPTFDVTPGSGAATTPTVAAGAGGSFTFTNSKGDKQTFTL